MRIVFLTTDLSLRSGGGIGTYVDTLACALGRAGHDIIVVTPNHSGRVPRNYRIISLPPMPASHDRRLRLAENFAAVVRDLCAVQSVDLVEATDWGLEGWECVRDGLTPVVVRLHTPESVVVEFNGGGRMLDSNAVIAAEGNYFRHAVLSAPSQAMARLIANRFPSCRMPITVLANPILEFPVFQDVAGDSAPRILFLGRLERRKGVKILANALQRVLPTEPKLQVDLVGPDTRTASGSVGRELREILAQWSDRVHFHGFLVGEAKFDLIHASRLTVLPSLWENFPYTALEVLACGRPVIATSGSGFDDFITEGVDGLLVQPGDANALAVAIACGLAMQFAPPAEIVARVHRFSPQVIVPQFEEFYREVVATWNRK
jgi:glycogen(starch) synthase